MRIDELNEKLGDLNRELAIANYKVSGSRPAKPWAYAVFAIMFLAAILIFKPQLTALVTHSNDFSFETVTIPEDALVILTANGIDYQKAVKDILYYYPTESAAIGTESVMAYKALLVAKPAQFGIPTGDYTITAKLMWRGNAIETITKEVSVGQADVSAGKARAEYDAQVKKNLADEEKKRAEDEKRFAQTHFDPATEKTRIEGKIKNSRFKVDRVDKVSDNYEVDVSDNGQPMVKFKGLKDTTELNEVKKFNFQGRYVGLKDKPNEKAEIRSEALFVNNISIDSADVTLFKSGPVNAILYCGDADWNIVNGDCSQWTATNIPFSDLGDRITFTVTHFTTYAGGWVNQSVSLDNNINNNLVFYRTTNSFNNLTLAKADVWNATFNPTSSNSESLYGVAVDASGVYLAGHDSSPGVGNEQWHAEKRDLNDGSLIWNATSNPSSNTDYIYGVAVDASGVYLAGHDTSPGNAQWRVEKRNLSTGLIIWNTTSNPSSSNDYIYGVAVDASGVYLAGQESSSSGQGRIEKRNLTDGSLIWNATNPTTNTVIYGVAVDSSGVYLAGYDFLLSVEFQWLIEKRNLTDGSLIWNATSNPSSSTDFVYGVAVDSSGVYLGGQDSSLGAANRQWRAEKRNLTDGSLIWNATSNPSSSDESISSVAVDSSGVYLAGYDSSSNGQWRVEKRNLSTGSSIWNATSNPSANSDILQGVAVDASGVYLVGRDWSPGDYQWRAEKRNKNDGSQNSTTYFDSGTYTQSLRANNNQSVIWDKISYQGIIPGLIVNNKLNQSENGTGTALPNNEGSFDVLGSIFQNTNKSDGIKLNYSASSCINTDEPTCLAAPCSSSCDFCSCQSSEATCTVNCGGTWVAGGYPSSGNYTSFLDTGQSSNDLFGWDNLSWSGIYPPGTNLSFSVKTSTTNSSAPDFSSGTCDAINQISDGTINLTGCANSGHRYIWYRSVLGTNNSEQTPELKKIQVSTNSTIGLGNITYQAATSSDNSTWSSFIGPDQTTSSYYAYSGQSLNLSNSQYLKYRFYLSTNDTSIAPILSNITVKYNYPTTDNGSVSSDTTRLVIWDSSDLGSYGNYVTFYANFTNFTSGLPINGTDINCALSENSTGTWSSEENMLYNDTGAIYLLSKSLSGPASFQVFCNGTAMQGFADINISEPTQGVISICDQGDISTECNVTTGHAITSNNYVLQANNLRIRSGGVINATPGTNSFTISLTGNLTIENGGKIETIAGYGNYSGNMTFTANTINVSGQIISLGGGCYGSISCDTGRSGSLSIRANAFYLSGNLSTNGGGFLSSTNARTYGSAAGNIMINSTTINLFFGSLINMSGGPAIATTTQYSYGGNGGILTINSNNSQLNGIIYARGGKAHGTGVDSGTRYAGAGGSAYITSSNITILNSLIDVSGETAYTYTDIASGGNGGNINITSNQIIINSTLNSFGGDGYFTTSGTRVTFNGGAGGVISLNSSNIIFHENSRLNLTGGRAYSSGGGTCNPGIGGNGGVLKISATNISATNLLAFPIYGTGQTTNGNYGNISINSPSFNASGKFSTQNISIDNAGSLTIPNGGYISTDANNSQITLQSASNITIASGGYILASAGAGQTAGNITIGANTTIISGNLSSKAFCTSNNCNENKTMNAGQIKITGSRLIIEGNLESVSYCSSGQFCNYATNYEKSIIQAGNITISSTSINLTGLIRTDGYCNGTSCNYANGGIGGDFNSNLRGGAIIINTTNITATSNLSAQAYCTGATCSQQCYHNTYINSGKITIYADNLDTTGTISTAGYCNGTNCATNEVCGIGSTYINGGQISINTASGLAIEKIDVSSNDLGGDYGSRRGGLINISASTQFSDDTIILNAYGENAYGNITFVSPKFNMTGSLSVYNISIDSSGNLLVRNSSYISYNASGSRIQAGGNISIDTYGSLGIGNFSYGDSISILGNLTTDSPGITFNGYNGGSVVAGYGSIMNLGDENLIVPRGQKITVTTIYAKNITALGKIILTGSDINADNLLVNDTVFASNVNVSGLINITSSGVLSALNITATEIINAGIINNTIGNSSMMINLTGNLSILAGGVLNTMAGAGMTAGNITILADILNNSGNITSRGGSCVGNGCVIGGSGLISVQSNSIYISGLIRTAGTDLTATTAWSFGGHAGNMRINSTLFSLLQGGSLNLDGGIVSSTIYNDPARFYGGNGGVLNLTSQRIVIQGSVNAKGGKAYSTDYASFTYGGSSGSVILSSNYETNITGTIDVSGGEVYTSYCALISGSSGGSINIIAQTLNLNSSMTSSGGYASSTNGGTPGSGGLINLNVTTLNSYSNSLMNASGGKVFVGATCTGGNGGAINVIARNISAERLNLLPIYGTGCVANGAYGTIGINSSFLNASGKFSSYNISIDNTGSLTIPNGGYISTDAASSLINIQSANNLTIALGGAIRSTSSGSINITLPAVYFAPFGNITSTSGNIYLNLPNFQNTSQSIYDNGAVINPAPWLYPDYLNCSLFNGNDVVFRIKCNLNGTYQFNNPQITNGSSVYVIGQTIINTNSTTINNSGTIYGQHNLTINSGNMTLANSGRIYFDLNDTYNLLINATNDLLIDPASSISSTLGLAVTGANITIIANNANISGNITQIGGGCTGPGCIIRKTGSINIYSANNTWINGRIMLIGTSLLDAAGYSYGGQTGDIAMNSANFILNGNINSIGGNASAWAQTTQKGGNIGLVNITSRNITLNGPINLIGGMGLTYSTGLGGNASAMYLSAEHIWLNSTIKCIGGDGVNAFGDTRTIFYGGRSCQFLINTTNLVMYNGANITLTGGRAFATGGGTCSAPCLGGNGGIMNLITNNATFDSNNMVTALYGLGNATNGTNGIINITKDTCGVPGGIFNPNPNVTYSQPCYLNVSANINQTKFFAGQTGRIWGNAIFGDGVNASNYTARISIDGVNRVNATTNWYGIYNTTLTFDATQTVGQNGLLANITTYTITNWSSSGVMEFWKMTKTVFNTPFNIIYDSFGRYNISAGLFRLDMNNQTIINNFTGGSASNVIAD